jgi:transposase
VNKGTLWNWVNSSKQATHRATDPTMVAGSELDELKRLRKEVIELRTDREILKRAAAFFARETMR